MNGLFRILCYLLAASALVKVLFGVFFHRHLYAFARRHYSADRPTPAVIALFVYDWPSSLPFGTPPFSHVNPMVTY